MNKNHILFLEEDINYILESIEYATTRDKAKNLLEKLDYDADAVIEFFLSNKGTITNFVKVCFYSKRGNKN